MRHRAVFKRLLASCMGAAVALGALPGSVDAAAKAGAPSKVGAVSFDRLNGTLLIPVDGKSPSVSITKLAPRQYVADLADSVLIRSEVQGQRLRGTLLAGWSLDETPTGRTVRLRLTLNDDVAPSVRFTPQSGGMLVQFPGTASATAAVHSDKRAITRMVNPVMPSVAARVSSPVARRSAVAGVKTTTQFPTAAPVRHDGQSLNRGIAMFGAVRGDRPSEVSSSRLIANAPPRVVVTRAPHHASLRPLPTRQAKRASVAARRAPVTSVAQRPAVPQLFGRALPAPVAQAVSGGHPLVLAERPLPLAIPAHRAPQAREAHQTTSTVAAGQASLGTPHYDARRGVLVIPVAGSVSARRLEVVQLNKRWAYLDIPGAHPNFTGVRFGNRKDPMFQRWVMAKRPARNTTRLSFALGAPASIDVELAGKELLVAVRPMRSLVGQAAPMTQPAPVAVRSLREGLAARVLPRIAANKTHLSRPFFDESRYGLVIPYEGRLPLYRLNAQTPQRVILEVKGDIAATGQMMQKFNRHPVMNSWKVSRTRTAGTVQVSLDFKRSAEVVIAADATRRQLLLIPQPSLASNDVAVFSSAAKTQLAAVSLEPNSQHIYIPFQGPLPHYTLEQLNQSFTYINFENADLVREGVQFFAPDYHPSLNYWLLSQRPQASGVRLALALAQPGGATVYEDRMYQRLVVVLGGAHTQVGATGRSPSLVPAPWTGAARPTGYKPNHSNTIKVSRQAS